MDKLGDHTAFQPLFDVFNYGIHHIEVEVAGALEQGGDITFIQLLMAALIEQEGYIRSQSAEALGRLGATQAVPLLMATSSVEYISHARQYATAMIHLEPTSALQVLGRYTKQFRRESWIDRYRGYALWKLHDINLIVSHKYFTGHRPKNFLSSRRDDLESTVHAGDSRTDSGSERRQSGLVTTKTVDASVRMVRVA